jgi:hypothetical protein
MSMTTMDYPSGDLRVSDADRDRALGALTEAFQAGRITAGELDQRCGEVLGARTGRELAVPLADLPPDGLEQARHREVATRIAMGASAVAATSLAAVSVANGLGGGGVSQHRQLVLDFLARAGLRLPVPPAPGFDWPGTVIPAAFAVLLVVLIVVLRVSRAGFSSR